MSESEPQSPCVSICVLDEQDICQGCFRSGVEITDWFMANAEQKRAILQRTAERREASYTVKLR